MNGTEPTETYRLQIVDRDRDSIVLVQPGEQRTYRIRSDLIRSMVESRNRSALVTIPAWYAADLGLPLSDPGKVTGRAIAGLPPPTFNAAPNGVFHALYDGRREFILWRIKTQDLTATFAPGQRIMSRRILDSAGNLIFRGVGFVQIDPERPRDRSVLVTWDTMRGGTIETAAREALVWIDSMTKAGTKRHRMPQARRGLCGLDIKKVSCVQCNQSSNRETKSGRPFADGICGDCRMELAR